MRWACDAKFFMEPGTLGMEFYASAPGLIEDPLLFEEPFVRSVEAEHEEELISGGG